jgi:hypothetical protein
MAASASAALLGIWALVVSGRGQLLVPPPHQVAEQFLNALRIHEYGAAGRVLTRDLRARTTDGDLRALARELEQTRPAPEDARGRSSAVQEAVASATVELRRQDGRTLHAEFRLERENGLWKLASVEPARAIARAERAR